MIRVAGKNGSGAIELLQEHDAHQLMRPGGRAERDLEFGASVEARRKPIGAADDEADGRTIFAAPLTKQRGESRAVEALAALIKNDNCCPLGNDIGDRDRFLDAPP